MKKFTIALLVAMMVLSLVACGGGDSGADGPVYTVEAEEVNPSIYPDDYPLIPAAEFEAAFEELKAANLKAEIKGYQDIVDFFGVDGAYYVNNDYERYEEMYKSYGWYGENSYGIIVSFKVVGDDLEYAGYASNGLY
jgi:predicted small lipoprotein YifL